MSASIIGSNEPTAAPETACTVDGWEWARVEQHLGGHFQIVRELGRGGMGAVFLARDIALHRSVAIKVLRAEYAASGEHRERFRREARMTARLSHPNIVPVHTFGESGELVYIIMKYVQGESLADRLRREGRLDPIETRHILYELAIALDVAHHDGVVHRDLKAENILIERATGRPILTDFGVALLRSLDPVHAERACAFGTPHYMSPEQAAGELDLDGRSDLYSIGVLGYLMLSGKLPFDAMTFEALAAKHIAEQPASLAVTAPEASAELVAVIERCLRKDREQRWPSGRALADALETMHSPRPLRRRQTAGVLATLFRSRAAAALIVGAAQSMILRLRG